MMTRKRKYQELSFAVMFVVITVLIWGTLLKKKSLQEHAKYVHSRESSGSDCFSPALFELKPGYPGCCPHKICPTDHFPFFLRSGAANMVGPKICFNNRIILSGGQNNVGWGVNIVIVDGETGMILRSDFFKVQSKGLHDFLKEVHNGNIVLVASYEDPTVQLTDEVRKLFAEMGSSMVSSVKYRDNWVFAGAVGLNKESPFEKLIVNDKKTNAYGDWPEIGELDGCFPRKV
ncbi:protein FAM3C isoform 1-T1 [Clarias gariepinus]